MDPLSITASAIGIAANVLKTALFVKEVIDQLKDGPAVARDIEDDITTTQGALRQVEAALAHDPQAIRRFRLDDVFDVSVKGCLETLERIDAEFDSFFGRQDWRVRLGIWWNGGEIRRLLGRLEAKKGSLMLLVQALSLRSVQEMHDLVRHNQATLDIARLGLEDMVPSYPAYTAKDLDSVASDVGSDKSILGDHESDISHTRFPFDIICFDTRAYRRAVSKKKARERKGTFLVLGSDHGQPIVAESNALTDSESSSGTATPNLPSVVELAVHEAVCQRLQEAEARIRALEEHVEEGSETPFHSHAGRSMVSESRRRKAKGNTEESPPPTATTRKGAVPQDGHKTKVNSSRPEQSLLIERIEGGKRNPAGGDTGKPSVRVTVTVRKAKSRRPGHDHIEILQDTPSRVRDSPSPSDISWIPADSSLDGSVPGAARECPSSEDMATGRAMSRKDPRRACTQRSREGKDTERQVSTSSTSATPAITNPKLLKLVEDKFKSILLELDAMKREQVLKEQRDRMAEPLPEHKPDDIQEIRLEDHIRTKN